MRAEIPAKDAENSDSYRSSSRRRTVRRSLTPTKRTDVYRERWVLLNTTPSPRCVT